MFPIIARQPTMSSREIAELTGSTHDNVLKTVRRLVAEGVVSGNETPYAHPQNGQTYQEFQLDFRNTMVVVSGYSAELRAAIIDRWQELEKQASPASQTLPSTQAKAFIQDMLDVAALFKVPEHIAQVEAVKGARLTHGVDFSVLLLSAPAQNDIKAEEEMLEPTELGKRFGFSSIRMNQVLASYGLQVKTDEGWTPTADGAGLCARHQWVKAGKSGYNWKWKVQAISDLIAEKV